MGIKHTFVSGVSDAADASKVRPSNWNADHTIDGPVDLPVGSTLDGGPFSVFKNVKDYGAVGDGTTDDTAAIQSAIDDVSGDYQGVGKGIIYFPVPASKYKVTSSLTYPTLTNRTITFMGEGPGISFVTIGGSFADYIFKRENTGDIAYDQVEFRNLSLENSSASNSAGCIYIGDTIGGLISNCRISVVGGTGIRTYGGSSAISVYASVVLGSSAATGSIGIMAGNATSVISTDVIGLDHGIRFANQGLVVLGGRFENNNVAMMLARDNTNARTGATGIFITGMSMESNNCHFYMDAVGSVQITGVKMQQFAASTPTNGIEIVVARDVLLQSIEMSGQYLNAAIKIHDCGPDIMLKNVTIENITTGVFYDIDPTVDTVTWENVVGYTPATLTIASGVIVANASFHKVDTQAAAASDDLDTITPSRDDRANGRRLVIRPADSARTIVAKDGTGNLKLAGDFSMDNEEDTLELIYDYALSKWLELGRSDNGA